MNPKLMPEKDFWEVEVSLKTPETDPRGAEACAHLTSFRPAAGASASPPGIPAVSVFDLYYLQADPPSLSESQVDRVARTLLADPVTQTYRVRHVLGGSTAGTSMPGAGAGSPGSPRSAESQTTSAQASSFGTRVSQATVLKKPGVMDPVEGSLLQALDDLGIDDPAVRGLRAR